MKFDLLKNPAFSRVAPFVFFMAFIGLEQGLHYLSEKQILLLSPNFFLWLYLPKAALVGGILWYFRYSYSEITIKDLLDFRKTALSVFSGLIIFMLWINMDWTLGSQASPAGFNPNSIVNDAIKWVIVFTRLVGAVVIVPIMEELFWRSFLLRYLIKSDFLMVEVGRISLFSFITVTILFGLEHHYVFAGIMAGAIFNYIYYATRSIAQCVLSHAIANFSLAVYVLQTGRWNFW